MRVPRLFVVVASLVAACVLVAASSAAAHGPRVVHPWQSIQKAIDRAKPGDKIIVKPGTYRENLEIATDGIKLVGFGATLKPPAQARPGFCDDEPGVVTGICVHGEFDEEFNPIRLVEDVEIKGLKVDGFSSSGVFAAGTDGFRAVLAEFSNNGGYGVFTFRSEGITYLHNRAHDNVEAGFYIGFSPEADAVVRGNVAWANLEGLLFGHAVGGDVAHNKFFDNCAGVIVLNAGALGPDGRVGEVLIRRNLVLRNNRSCPGDEEEETPPVSGAGIALAGAVENTVRHNIVLGNEPSGPSILSGGIVLFDTTPLGGASPDDNRVARNLVQNNEPLDIDGLAGTGNVFLGNLCGTSAPPDICD